MAESVPYKVVALEPGVADVVDRATGSVLGRVERSVPSWENGYVRGWYAVLGVAIKGRHASRADAARVVWEASRG